MALLKLAEKEKLWDGWIDTYGTMKGGLAIQWILEYEGNKRLKSVTLSYDPNDELRLQADTLEPKALEIISFIGLFLKIKEEAEKKAAEEKDKKREKELKDGSRYEGQDWSYF